MSARKVTARFSGRSEYINKIWTFYVESSAYDLKFGDYCGVDITVFPESSVLYFRIFLFNVYKKLTLLEIDKRQIECSITSILGLT